MGDGSPARGIFEMNVLMGGRVIKTVSEPNLIVEGARVLMSRFLAQGQVEGGNIAKIAFGTSGEGPVQADTAIEGAFCKPVGSVSFPRPGSVRFDWELTVTENNGMAIMEFGLLTAGGTLFARRTREAPVVKADDISLEGSWTIIF